MHFIPASKILDETYTIRKGVKFWIICKQN